jgi:phosphomevalonate kinase
MVTVPGKVLITGGYLVLDGYKGIVVGTEARFTSKTTASNFSLIESCQFDTKYSYASPPTDVLLDTELPKSELPREVIDSRLNLFIHFPILIIKSLVELSNPPTTLGGFHIKIFADNDFYSQQSNIAGMCPLRI